MKSSPLKDEQVDMLNTDQIKRIKAIKCMNISPNFTREDVEKHFIKFGNITKLIFRKEKQYAVIHYQDHVSLMAKIILIDTFSMLRITVDLG